MRPRKNLRQALGRSLADFELLLEGKLMLFLIGDFLFLLWGVLAALAGGGKLDKIYPAGVVTPLLVLLPTALSSLIALERRAGSLDLALAAPNPPAYFLRRLWAPLLLLLGQGILLLLLTALSLSTWAALLRAFFSMILVACTVASALLFWATRLRKAGAVLLASAATLIPLVPFLYTSPVLGPAPLFPKSFFDAYQAELAWIWAMLVLTFATLILFFAALDRLRRPEAMS